MFGTCNGAASDHWSPSGEAPGQRQCARVGARLVAVEAANDQAGLARRVLDDITGGNQFGLGSGRDGDEARIAERRVPVGQFASRRASTSDSRECRAVDMKPLRRRSSASAKSAVREASTLRTAFSGPRGSITTDKAARAEPSSNGARKSLRTSVLGHSATQYVTCSKPSMRTWAHSSSMAMGHGSLETSAVVGAPGKGLIGAHEAGDEIVHTEHSLDHDVGIRQQPGQ